MFPLVQLPKKLKDDPSGGTDTHNVFPLVQLPKKLKEALIIFASQYLLEFPLVQLPKKLKETL